MSHWGDVFTFWATLPGLGRQPNLWLNLFLETTPSSESLESLIHFLVSLGQKLWLKNPVFDKNKKVSQK